MLHDLLSLFFLVLFKEMYSTEHIRHGKQSTLRSHRLGRESTCDRVSTYAAAGSREHVR